MLIPFGLGILTKPENKEGWFFRWWIAGALLYWIVIARGNVQHDYYQILVIPVVSIYLAKGLKFLLTNNYFSRWVSLGLATTSFVLGLAFSWYTIRTYYWINHPEIVEVGFAADKLLPENAKIIAPYGGDTTFLYQTRRNGWPVGFNILHKISYGAQYYVSANPNDDEVKALKKYYPVITSTQKYVIIDLRKRLPNGEMGVPKLP